MTQNINDRLEELVNPNQRKLSLFACACVREVWQLLDDERQKRALEVTELFLDKLVSEKEVTTAADEALHEAWHANGLYNCDAAYAVRSAIYYITSQMPNLMSISDVGWAAAYAIAAAKSATHSEQQALLRQHQLFDCIFGE